MKEKLEQLKTLLARIADLEYAAAVLDWDQETYMPEGGVQARADQLSTLQGLAHEYFVDEEVGTLLHDLAAHLDELDYDSDEASLIRVSLRDYEKQVKVHGDLVREISRTSALGTQAWREAREKDDFSLFQPYLEKMVELKIRWAECFKPYDNIYDPLLDDFEPGMTYEQISAVFAELKPPLVELVRAISQKRDAVDDSVLKAHFDKDAQMAFGRAVAEQLGYDLTRGRIDISAHPFTTNFWRGDVRITTRLDENDVVSGLMGTIHEAGHAIYEQNTSPTLYRTGLDRGASMAVHESQSRFYENVIGRSRPFWRHFYPRLQEAFPHFKSLDFEAFYRALNKSEPSLIRVEADEVTYGLHIILRFELENDLFNGRVSVADLPEVWNARMEEYLGLVPPTDREGVLQDIHWSQGLMGYFPDYLLGSVFSVQLWEQMQKEMPDVVEQIEAGQFEDILAWLREKIHRHGRKFTLPEITARVTGGPLRWEPYMDYLRTKYGEIYGL